MGLFLVPIECLLLIAFFLMLLIITISNPIAPACPLHPLWWNRVNIGQEEPLYAPSNEKVCFKAGKRHMGHDPQYDVPVCPSSHSDIFRRALSEDSVRPLRSFPPQLLYWRP